MLATKSLRQAMGDLLAADTATLAPAVLANKIALIMEPWTPSESTVLGDVTLATFDGSTPISAGTGTQPSGSDPLTGDYKINIKVPAGGFRFETTGLTNLPQTIWGFCLTDNAGAVLLASERFDQEIVLSAVNQEITVDSPDLRVLAGSLR